MRLVVQIMSETSSDKSERDNDESLQLMQDVKAQVASFVPLIGALETQIESIRARATNTKANLLTDAVPIKCARASAWLGKESATVSEFVRTVLERGVIKTDLESRSLWLQPTAAAALGLPEGRMHFFELLRGLERWLAVS
jgi:hypothetical protein